MELTYNQSERIVELAFHQVYYTLKENIPSEKFYLFLEALTRVFEIDYTSISIAAAQFVSKIGPTKQEKVLFAIITGAKLKDLGLDYRTIRSHKQKLGTGKYDLYPRIMNRFLRDDLRKFVKAYLNLFPASAIYLHQFNLGGGFDEVS